MFMCILPFLVDSGNFPTSLVAFQVVFSDSQYQPLKLWTFSMWFLFLIFQTLEKILKASCTALFCHSHLNAFQSAKKGEINTGFICKHNYFLLSGLLQIRLSPLWFLVFWSTAIKLVCFKMRIGRLSKLGLTEVEGSTVQYCIVLSKCHWISYSVFWSWALWMDKCVIIWQCLLSEECNSGQFCLL